MSAKGGQTEQRLWPPTLGVVKLYRSKEVGEDGV